MGITALISTIIGLVGGILPRVMTWLESASQHKREVDFVKLQHDLQMERMKADAGAKLREAESNVVAEEVRAMREHLTAIIENQAKPSGFAWIDAFNALLRPSATVVVLVMFCGYAVVMIQLYRSGQIATAEALAKAISLNYVGLAFEGVLGFLFGVRTTMRRS